LTIDLYDDTLWISKTVFFSKDSSGSDADGSNDEDDQIEYESLVDVMFKEDKEMDHEYLTLTGNTTVIC
jgi:hypothetical protein